MIDVAEQYRKMQRLEKISNALTLSGLFLLAIFVGLVIGVEVGKKESGIDYCIETLQRSLYENQL